MKISCRAIFSGGIFKNRVMLCAVACLFGFHIPAFAGEAIKAGPWKAWVSSTLVGDPQKHAPDFRYDVHRQGPDDKDSTILYSETSNRGLTIRLNDDGTVLIQGMRGMRLIFTDRRELPLTLPIPKYSTDPMMNACIEKYAFVGDVLVYSRPYPGHALIGFVRIDATNGRLQENRLSLDVDDERTQQIARAACMEWDRGLFRAGELVFWTNNGGEKDIRGKIQNEKKPWQVRKVNVLDLNLNKVKDAAEVPPEALRSYKKELMDFIEKDRGRPEMEAWAVSVLGQVGTKSDVERLERLLNSCEYDPLRVHYAAAIKAVSSRQ
jgi:hypothetical protein